MPTESKDPHTFLVRFAPPLLAAVVPTLAFLLWTQVALLAALQWAWVLFWIMVVAELAALALLPTRSRRYTYFAAPIGLLVLVGSIFNAPTEAHLLTMERDLPLPPNAERESHYACTGRLINFAASNCPFVTVGYTLPSDTNASSAARMLVAQYEEQGWVDWSGSGPIQVKTSEHAQDRHYFGAVKGGLTVTGSFFLGDGPDRHYAVEVVWRP